MTKLLLHCGLEKTGSSSIQAFIDRNRQQLLGHGVYTLEDSDDVGVSGGSFFGLKEYCLNHAPWGYVRSVGALAGNDRELAITKFRHLLMPSFMLAQQVEAAQAGANFILISAETSGNIKRPWLDELLGFLAFYGDLRSVLLYSRDSRQMRSSLYRTWVLDGESASEAAWANSYETLDTHNATRHGE